MNFAALKSLVRINQVQSFSKAAELENMTLSALSMQMKALELQLDAALFDRNFRPPKLTPMGKNIAAHAGEVLSAQQALVEAASGDSALEGRFHLGFIQSTSVRIMPGFLKKMRRNYPKADVKLSSNLSEDLTEQVRLGVLDAAVVTGVALPEKELHFSQLGVEEMAFAVPVHLRDVPLEQLPGELPFLHFRPTSGIGRLIEEAIEKLYKIPKDIIVLDSLEAAMECVKEGLGYTLLPLPDIMRSGDARTYVHKKHIPLIERDLVLVVRRENARNAWAQELATVLRSCFDEARIR